jgi:hypothetical protein
VLFCSLLAVAEPRAVSAGALHDHPFGQVEGLDEEGPVVVDGREIVVDLREHGPRRHWSAPPSGLLLAPYPRRSAATTVKWSASRGARRCHIASVCG